MEHQNPCYSHIGSGFRILHLVRDRDLYHPLRTEPVPKKWEMMERKDKNWQTIAVWAEKRSIGVAQCKFCLVTFKTGKKSLIAHSETKKHISHTPIYPAKVTQLKIKESLSGIIVKETDEIKKKKTR